MIEGRLQKTAEMMVSALFDPQLLEKVNKELLLIFFR